MLDDLHLLYHSYHPHNYIFFLIIIITYEEFMHNTFTLMDYYYAYNWHRVAWSIWKYTYEASPVSIFIMAEEEVVTIFRRNTDTYLQESEVT